MPSIRPRHALIGTVVYTVIMVAALVIPASPPHAQRGYLRDIPLGRRLVERREPRRSTRPRGIHQARVFIE